MPPAEYVMFGKAFEAAVLKAVGLEKNATHSTPASGQARYRIPDGVDENAVVLLEVKGVKYLNLTDQLKDFLATAETNRQKVIVVVKNSTRLSEQYKERLAQGDLTMARIDASIPEPTREHLDATPADFEEASTNFDLHGVPPFLERLTTLVDGFGNAEKETVDQLLDSMEVEEEAELAFPVAFRGEEVRLRFKFFLCDEGAVDLAVFTVPPLSQQIQEAMGDE